MMDNEFNIDPNYQATLVSIVSSGVYRLGQTRLLDNIVVHTL